MEQATDAPQTERTDDTRTPDAISRFWQTQIALAEHAEQDWVKRGQAIVERYKRERLTSSKAQASARRFNVLYSNTETLKAALYGKTPNPDVRRRFADADPIAKSAAEVIERGLIYCAESYDVDRPVNAGLHEYLLPGRGVMRVLYEPIIGQRPVIDPMTSAPIAGADGNPLMQDFIADQKLKLQHVFWRDFLHSPARCWDDVWWIAYRHAMSREDLRVSGFNDADKVPLNWEPKTNDRKDIPESLKKAEVWEIWDKSRGERVWIVKGYDRPLRMEKDPYGLSSFFPSAEPLYAMVDTETLVPTPEFAVYQDQADDLDEIVTRISKLTKALKRRGVFNAAIKELERLQHAPDNAFIPVTNWEGLSAQGGLEKAFETEDITAIAQVLKELYVQREQLVQAIWEVVGIADIMRGVSDPNETYGAQQLKANFGSNRLKKRQRAVQKWIRDHYKLKAEILAEHFEPQVLQEMTGQPIDEKVLQLLRTDKLRAYRIDIETDSTIFEDAEAEKQAILEMVTEVTKYLQAAMPAAAQEPLLTPLLFEMLEVAIRSVKQGRKIEDVIEQTKNAIMQKVSQAVQNPQPPQPSPDVLAKLQVDRERLAAEKEEKDRRFALDAEKQGHEMQLAREQHEDQRGQVQFDQHVKAHEMEHRDREADRADSELDHRRVMDTMTFEDGIEARHEQAAQADRQQARDLKARGIEAAQTDDGEGGEVMMTTQEAAQKRTDEVLNKVAEALDHMAEGFTQLAKAQSAPKRLVRGKDGRASHVETVM